MRGSVPRCVIHPRTAMVLARHLTNFLNRASILMLRPYIYRELPGWGLLYRHLIGDYRAEARWKDAGRRWIRGKLHDYEMLLDLGYWPNRSAFFLGRYYDLPTQLALAAILRAGDSFVDVGANQGMISLLAARLVGPTGQVTAFEPNPRPRASFELAASRNAISHLAIHAVGLGEAESVLELRIPKINSGEGSFGHPAYAPSELETIACPVARGDTFLKSSTPRAIKIDVEGYELYVLRGLDATLAGARPILILELVSRHLANAGCSVEDVTAFLHTRGYRAYRLGLRSLGRRKVLSLTPAIPAGDVDGDYLWACADNPLPEAIANQEPARNGPSLAGRPDRRAALVARTQP
jgi:FkbM family methyltransferase